MPVERLRRILRPAILLGLGVWLAGCSTTGAPPGWLPVAEDAPRETYGAWIQVDFTGGAGRSSLMGEFLAVGPDSIFVLAHEARIAGPVTAIARGDIGGAKIAWFDPEAGRAGGWVGMGTVLSLSNGGLAAITWPLWWVGGGIMAGSQSRESLEGWPGLRWEELRAYARFPQGMPPHLDRATLLRKPRWSRPAKQPLPRRSDAATGDF